VDGTEELLQRALIRLTVKRGAFALKTGLGAELSALRGVPPGQRVGEALRLAREALAGLPGVEVQGVEVSEDGGGGLAVRVLLLTAGQPAETEVKV